MNVPTQQETSPTLADYKAWLNNMLDEAEPVLATLERAKAELEALPDTSTSIQTLRANRAELIAESYMMGNHADTAAIDAQIQQAKTEAAKHADRRKELETVLEVVSGRTLRLNHECHDIISKAIPNICYGDIDEALPF